MRSVDVVVAGGGPGGLAAAEVIARHGFSVDLLERGHEIGAPVRTSGGSFVDEMEALGIPANLYHPVRRCRFISPNETAQFAYEGPAGCVIDVRGVFQFLAERAIAAGARVRLATAALKPVMEGDSVTGVTFKSDFAGESAANCKILIDATGYKALLLKQAGVHGGFQRFGVGAEYDLYAPAYDQDEAVLIVGSRVAPSGYAWAFPWGRNRVRVGVGIIHADSSAHPDDYLDRLIANASVFQMDLRGAQPIEYHFGLIPSDGLADRFTGNGIMGAGDSAGQPSALLGEGIRWAIKAGRMAGEVASKALKTGDVSRAYLSKYERQWRSAFGKNLKLAAEVNKRIAKWDDEKWDRRTEILKRLSPYQFGEALKTNLSAGWIMKLLWTLKTRTPVSSVKNPRG